MSKISVVIPAFNCENFIERCVESIYDDKEYIKEVIIVNDGSTDNTKLILEEMSKKYDNIHVFNISNGGSAKARNYGLNHITGEYVYFLDSDDYISDSYISKMYAKIVLENVDFVCSSYIEEFGKFSVQEKTFYKEKSYDKHELSLEFYPSLICDKTLECRVPKTLWNKLF